MPLIKLSVAAAAINRLKVSKVLSNTKDAAYGDTEKTCRLDDTVGISPATDFSTRTAGGNRPQYWNEVFGKYASSLLKD